MSYRLSASKIQTYHRCAFSYYARYERGVNAPTYFGGVALGTAIHETLAIAHHNWHYQDPIPDLEWFLECWDIKSTHLEPSQVEEGKQILASYHQHFIAPVVSMYRPVAVEGQIAATILVESLEFTLTGRYDRLDLADDGLELIDYKTTKVVKLPDPDEIDLQLGLYFMALEQTYNKLLTRMSLWFVRTGEKLSYEATEDHKAHVTKVVGDLAVKLRSDTDWNPNPGDHCSRCGFKRYCAAVSESPLPLPTPCEGSPDRSLQLTLLAM